MGCPASPILDAVRSSQSPLAVVSSLEAGGRVMLSNDAFAAAFGKLAAELNGHALRELTSDEVEAKAIQLALAEVGNVHVSTTRLCSFGGSDLQTAALSLAPVRAASGETFCVMCSLVVDAEAQPEMIERDAESLANLAKLAGECLAPASRSYESALPN